MHIEEFLLYLHQHGLSLKLRGESLMIERLAGNLKTQWKVRKQSFREKLKDVYQFVIIND